MHELFVYWRLDRVNLGLAQAAMQGWQAELAQSWPGLVARLYVRADAGDGSSTTEATLMETYARPGGVDAALQQQILAQGAAVTAPWRRGQRHVEVFVALER